LVADVLFIYNDSSSHTAYTVGLGIAAVSAHLKRQGITSELLYCKTRADVLSVVTRAAAADPLVAAFYGPSSGLPALAEMSRSLRRAFPDLFQVCGGPQATLEPDDVLAATVLDAVCVGYGEEPLLRLVRRLQRGEDVTDVVGLHVAERGAGSLVVKRNPPWDWFADSDPDSLLGFDYRLFFDELQRFPDFGLEGRYLEIILCRGCVYDCSFCSAHALREVIGRRPFRPSVDASMRVLKQAIEDTGLERVCLHDDVLTLDKPWFHEFIDRYGREVSLPFICNLRAGTFGDAEVRALKAAGVEYVFVGVESGNDAIRREVLNKGISREQLLEGFRLLHAHDVPVVTQNLIGLPGETPEAFLDTVRMNALLDPSAMIISVFYPYPGTALEQVCIERKLFSARHLRGAHERDDTVLALPGFPRKTVLFYRRHFTGFVRYERRRRQHPRLVCVPLEARTAVPIGLALDAYTWLRGLRA
jgi:anaerobic magnesium-protoporphyrin IX monomethyl ester cyclase